jgi:hypothetical protein
VVSAGGQYRWSSFAGPFNLFRVNRLRRPSIPALDNQAQPGGSQVRWQFADRPKWSTPQVVWPALAITRAPRGMAHDSRLTACLALIDPKGAYLSAHPPYAPGKVGLSKILVPGVKPQKISEFQVPRLELAVPRFASDATWRRRGAPCCGVWRRVGWMLALPLRRLSRP